MLIRLLRSLPAPLPRACSWPSSCCRPCRPMASLYLPSLNADIIDNGVATGDTAYIWSTGADHARRHRRPGRLRHRRRLLRLPGRHGLRARRAQQPLPPRDRLLGREVDHFGAPSLITRITNDVQQVQMLVLMTCTLLVAAPIMAIGGIVMALREDVGLSWLLLVSIPALLICVGHRRVADGSRSSASCRHASTRQPGAARADHRHPRGAGLRPRAGRGEALRRAPTEDLTDTSLRAGRLMALMFPTVIGRSSTCRASRCCGSAATGSTAGTHVDRRTHRLPQLPHPDPHRRDDGHVHGDHGAPRRGVRRADPGGARHRRRPSSRRRTPVTRGHASRRRSSCATSGSATPAPRPRAARTSPCTRWPARRRRSSGAPAPARPRSSTSSRASSTSPSGAVLVDGVDVRDLDPEVLRQPHRPRPAEAVPVHRHRRQQPALRQARRHRRASCWDGARGGAGRGLRGGHARWSRRQHRPGRQPTSPAASASGSPSPARWCGRPEIYLFDDSFSALDLATDARLRAALVPYTTREHGRRSSPSGSPPSPTPTRSSCSRTARWSGWAPTTSCWRAARPTPRSWRRRSAGRRRREHDRPSHGSAAAAGVRDAGRPAAGGGRFGSTAGMPAEKSPDFGASLRRLLGRAAASSAAACHRRARAGGLQRHARRARPEDPRPRHEHHRRRRHRTRGVRPSTAPARTLLVRAGLYVGVVRPRLPAGPYSLAGVVQRTMYRLRSDVEDKLNRLPAQLRRRAAPGRPAEPRHQRHRQRRPEPAADASASCSPPCSRSSACW